jgi:hypothetical protein
MYDSDSYLVPNALNRYSRSSGDALNANNHGSLALCIQHDSPRPEGEANWPPAPTGGVVLAMRLYWPKPEVADGTWTPPPVERVG